MLVLEMEHLLIAGLVILVMGVLLLLTVALRRTLRQPMQEVDRAMQAIKKSAIATVNVETPVRVSLTPALPNVSEATDASQNAEERRTRVKQIAANFDSLKKTKKEILTTEDYSVLEGEVPVQYNGQLHKPKVVIVNPGSATEEETMELMEFARSKFIKKEEE